MAAVLKTVDYCWPVLRVVQVFSADMLMFMSSLSTGPNCSLNWSIYTMIQLPLLETCTVNYLQVVSCCFICTWDC